MSEPKPNVVARIEVIMTDSGQVGINLANINAMNGYGMLELARQHIQRQLTREAGIVMPAGPIPGLRAN